MVPETVITDPDINQGAILRRYMDIPKLLDLLHYRTLYLPRADGFADRLEGALFPSLRKLINQTHANGESPHDADYFHRRARIGNYVSCWTCDGKDSMALWQLYGGVNNSVAVTSTVEHILRTAVNWNRRVLIHRVKYIDYLSMKNFLVGDYADVLKYKHKAYRYEKELRIVVPQQCDNWQSNPRGLRLPVTELDSFIRSVVVAPEASKEFFESIKSLCTKFGLGAPVRRSKLALIPV